MTPIIKKIDSFYFRTFPSLLMCIFLCTMFVKLSMMQLDGLLGFGGGFVTALFAMTSLMYARARAVSDASEMAIRSQIADESLKASFIAAMGLGIAAYSFMSLSETYLPRTGNPFDPKTPVDWDLMPTVFATLTTLIFAVPTVVKVLGVVEMTVENMGLVLKKPKIANSAPANHSDPAA